jgi:PilZ domain-containing protein
MAWGARKSDRVTFVRGHIVHIMGIDGTWRRKCTLLDVSATGARLTVDGSIEGLKLTEFFLLLSSAGLAFRRCSLVRVNGDQIGLKFSEGQPRKKQSARSGVEPATTSEA